MNLIVEEAHQATFAAMGNTVNVVVVGGNGEHVAWARRRIAELESRWSRFIASSDISRMNRAEGRPTEVAPETISLLQYMVDAYRITSGLFDPTRLPQLIAAGYQRSMVSERMTILPEGVHWSHGLDDVVINAGSRCVTLPPDVTIDAGGIAKGFAADIMATEIIVNGARGALVNVGGDLRCIGEGDRDGAWDIAIANPLGSAEIDRVRLHSGAVATSSLFAKTFERGDQSSSHLIDPRIDRALSLVDSKVVQATVIARECVWAEAFTKAVILDEPRHGMALIDGLDLAALMVTDDGSIQGSLNWGRFQA